MSQTGATLSGSYSGASATPTEVGFKYGTTSGNLTESIAATDSNGSLSATLSGLTAGTTYYYKAYVTVAGTGDYSSQNQIFYGSECSFQTDGIGTVSTGGASNVTTTTATLSASYSGVVTGDHAPQNIYFKYGTTSGSLNNPVGYSNGITSSSGSFSAAVSGLESNTTYYYKVFMSVWNGYQYVEISSGEASFKTAAEGAVAQGYLGCYEMPTVSVSGTGTTGYYNSDSRDDRWYKYNTGTSTQKIVTHTFTGSTRVRNYTVLFDSGKHAPLWAAFPMHANVYGGSTSRSNAWTTDPASLTGEQTGLDNANDVGYSRGHFVASQYRKKNDASNLQTFYYSNQAPQRQTGFNDSVWSDLEDKVLSSSPTSAGDTLYVVVGVLYEESYYSANPSFLRTRPSSGVNIPIPTHFYTCLMKCTFSGSTITDAKGIAFVYPNVSHSGENYYKAEYITSIDNIESRAGFEFFPRVPANLQTAAESNLDARWFEPKAPAPASNSNIAPVTGNSWGSF
ncbi:MAG: DNA/RNA non-specific endonuclease [Bacteroidales bacterium]|nr:DNA/RNA non-specific endonuclease [Bacteroidales bacterium]